MIGLVVYRFMSKILAINNDESLKTVNIGKIVKQVSLTSLSDNKR